LLGFVRKHSRFTVSAATVSEIPAGSLPLPSGIGLKVTEQPSGSWDPNWIGEYWKRDLDNPLDAAFSDSRHFP